MAFLIEPEVVTDASLTSNVPETEPAWNSATNYTTTMSARGETAATTHLVYICILANSNKPPSLNPTYWKLQGSTNRWAMFDRSVQSQTVFPELIEITHQAVGRVDSIALLNMRANSVEISIEDSVEGTVFDQVFNLISTDGISDWFAYFTDPIEKSTDLTITNLPPFSGTEVTISLRDPGDTVACGLCNMGFAQDLGPAEYGASVGIQDYSLKQRDDWGNLTILQRAYANRASMRMYVPAARVDRVKALLTKYRATPLIYVGHQDYAALTVYGFPKDWAIEFSYKRYSLLSLELEGLT